MQSPSFKSRQQALEGIFRTGALRRTWRTKVRYALRDRVLPDPVAHMDFHSDLRAGADRLAALVTSGQYRPKAPARILMEKSKGLCRQIVLPAADDALILQRLSDTFFAVVRGSTPSKHAYFEPDSFTFTEDGRRSRGYGSLAAWLHFQKRLEFICQANRFVVITDIANYYDYIGFKSLRNIIASTAPTSETVLDLLLYILSAMNWSPDYMPTSEMGLPQIDLDAPRVLAHSFLFDLDRYAVGQAPDRFTRYMDDINFGANSISECKRLVRDVDLILHTRQVRLNSGKTSILDAEAARQHFRFNDHAELDTVQSLLQVSSKGSLAFKAAKRSVSRRFTSDYNRANFHDGHGDKVLKRLIFLARMSEYRISTKTIDDILRSKPTCRDAALAYLSARPATPSTIAAICRFTRDADTIDDVGPLTAASTLVNMKVRARSALQDQLSLTVAHLEQGDIYRRYAALWLLSKYGTAEEILTHLRRYAPTWTGHHEYGRLAGGLLPRMFGTPYFDQYRLLIQSSASQAAGSTFRFHSRLTVDPQAARAVGRYVQSPNRSMPNRLTHAKALVMLSLLKGRAVDGSRKDQLIAAHSAALEDVFYKAHFAAALRV